MLIVVLAFQCAQLTAGIHYTGYDGPSDRLIDADGGGEIRAAQTLRADGQTTEATADRVFTKIKKEHSISARLMRSGTIRAGAINRQQPETKLRPSTCCLKGKKAA